MGKDFLCKAILLQIVVRSGMGAKHEKPMLL